VDFLRIKLTGLYQFLHLCDHHLGCSGHVLVEVPGCFPEYQVAQSVSFPSSYKSKVSKYRFFKDVLDSVEDFRLPRLGILIDVLASRMVFDGRASTLDDGPYSRGGVEPRDACSS
jgi:hypothetical protein